LFYRNAAIIIGTGKLKVKTSACQSQKDRDKANEDNNNESSRSQTDLLLRDSAVVLSLFIFLTAMIWTPMQG